MAGTPVSEQGRETRVQVGDGQNAESFVQCAGETELAWTRASKELDLSSKDDGVYETGGFGQQKVSFKVSGKVKLPDAGFQRMSDVSKMSPPAEDIKIVRGAVVRYAGQVHVGNFSATFGDGAATYSYDMIASQVPTVDNLAATA
jgi:hypothetical protein